jgi:hypothetical protein
MAKKAKARRRVKASTTALARRQAALPPAGVESPMQVVARIARDRSIDVDKFAKVIELQKDLMATQAKIDFEVAYNQMEPELPIILKRGKIKGKNRPVIPFARLDDIHRVTKPILQRHGFSVRHRTEWPPDKPNAVRIVGILRHRSGHSETSAFEGPADTSDYRSHIQSLGSTVSYGRRYTTIDLLNLTIEGQDDDGQKGAEPIEPRPAAREYREPERQAPASPNPKAGEAITPKQSDRLWRIVQNSGRSEEEVSRWLADRFGYAKWDDIRRVDYDYVCNCIESPTKLPARRG